MLIGPFLLIRQKVLIENQSLIERQLSQLTVKIKNAVIAFNMLYDTYFHTDVLLRKSKGVLVYEKVIIE